jgi:hypothetical protein
MTAQHDINNAVTGWYVYDIITGAPAKVNDRPQIGMSFEDADDLADLLNHLHAEQAEQLYVN